jgi:hypothetical protein
LHGKTFEWIDETKNVNGPSYGFIAQEVQDHFPSLVATTFDNKLAVDYAKVVAILVESVKELYQYVVDANLINPQVQYTPTTIAPVNDNHECPTSITKNLVGISAGTNAQSVVAQLATTADDQVSITPLINDSYLLFANSGTNRIDGVTVQVGQTILVKDIQDARYNGLYSVDGIDTNESLGTFAIVSRLVNQQTHASLSGTLVFVHSDELYSNVGTNNERVFICTIDATTDTFLLDVTPIAYVAFDGGLKSMAYQNHDSVSITGGDMRLESLTVDVLQPSSANELTIRLKGNTSNDAVVVHNGTQEVFRVDGTGLASALIGIVNPSDERLKKNVNQITNSLQLVQNLRGVTFDWIDKVSDNPQYGFIAQEVALRFPSLVHTRADGLLAVDYSKVVAILVECVKDLSQLLSV